MLLTDTCGGEGIHARFYSRIVGKRAVDGSRRGDTRKYEPARLRPRVCKGKRRCAYQKRTWRQNTAANRDELHQHGSMGAWEMFAQEMNIMQQITGLSGAINGQQARAGTPSSLYAQEAQNSLLTIR